MKRKVLMICFGYDEYLSFTNSSKQNMDPSDSLPFINMKRITTLLCPDQEDGCSLPGIHRQVAG